MDHDRRIITGGGIIVNGTAIEHVLAPDTLRHMDRFDGDLIDVPDLIAVPGFIQTHIHLCQTLFRGLADDHDLLDWLKFKIFPFEAAHDERSMHASAMLGIAELIRSGTTTIMDMGSVDHEEHIVRALSDAGLRAFVGKCMMDENEIYPKLKESTDSALTSTLSQARQWHNAANGRIRYAVAPRFVLSCSERLLREAYDMTRDFPGMLFHTHAAESQREMAAIQGRCKMGNVEFFASIGALHANTCLAHCIWLNDAEMHLLAERRAHVCHCPSNLKLGSGIARIPEFLARGISVSIGADGAPCNNTLDIFHEMRLAALIQKPQHGPQAMPAKTIFEMATVGGATTLGLEREVGSIEPARKADIVLLDVERVWSPAKEASDEDVYSTIVYTCSPENVHSVMADGRWLYRNGEHVSLDDHEVVHTARSELRRLLGRVQP
jgi:cytosine/adenosine deaminase-related metal-dependent hydrolase